MTRQIAVYTDITSFLFVFVKIATHNVQTRSKRTGFASSLGPTARVQKQSAFSNSVIVLCSGRVSLLFYLKYLSDWRKFTCFLNQIPVTFSGKVLPSDYCCITNDCVLLMQIEQPFCMNRRCWTNISKWTDGCHQRLPFGWRHFSRSWPSVFSPKSA